MSGTPRTRSLDKAVLLLRAVAATTEPRSASALGRVTGIPRATATRTLRTLADAGFAEEERGGWVLGRELVRLARAADPHRQLVRLARPVLEELRDATGESALLGVPRDPVGLDIVEQVDALHLVGVADWVGRDIPLHASAAGKLVLAELPPEDLDAWLAGSTRAAFTPRTVTEAPALRRELARVRARGLAELVDELEEGLTSVSVAARGPDGSLAALVGISGPTFRLSRRRRSELAPVIGAAAQRLEEAMRRAHPGDPPRPV